MDPIKLAVLAEHLEVDKRVVETAVVRVTKTVALHEERVDMSLQHDEVVIERVGVNRLVDAAVGPRQEGDVTIVPVYEEVLVTRLLLKEEVHITRRRRTEPREPQHVVLRAEQVRITRTPIVAPEPGGRSDQEPL